MKYIIITQIPFSITENGSYAVNTSWGWDLEAHLKVCKKLHIFAPIIPYDSQKTDFTFDKESIEFHKLPFSKNIFNFIVNIPKIMQIFNKEFNKNDIIHSTAVFYPPLGIMANFMALLKQCDYRLFVIDGDFISDVELKIKFETNIFKKLILYFLKNFYSFIFRFCINNSKWTFVVGDKLYERYRKHRNVFKIYASWIKEKDIISIKELKERNEYRNQEFKICFAATLKSSKNPICTIETVKILKERKFPIKLDIFGDGPQKNEVEELIKKYNLCNDVHLKGIVEYGKPFYDVLRNYDAILIPNLSGEQPRIIFDAWANGVAVIGSDIESFRIISNKFNGILCNPNNPNCFANAIEKIYFDKKLFEKVVINGRTKVKENTIEFMHEARMRILRSSITNEFL